MTPEEDTYLNKLHELIYMPKNKKMYIVLWIYSNMAVFDNGESESWARQNLLVCSIDLIFWSCTYIQQLNTYLGWDAYSLLKYGRLLRGSICCQI